MLEGVLFFVGICAIFAAVPLLISVATVKVTETENSLTAEVIQTDILKIRESEMNSSMITSALEIPGYEITQNIGIVRGLVVRSRSVVGSFFGGLQMFFGGNITIYTNMCEQARREAFEIMCSHATANGANAIIAMKYDATEVMPGVTEVLCYGTAVIASQKNPRGSQT